MDRALLSELSDAELMVRLTQRGVDTEDARYLVRHREVSGAVRVILAICSGRLPSGRVEW